MLKNKEIILQMLDYKPINNINYVNKLDKNIALYPLYANQNGYVMSKIIWKRFKKFLEKINCKKLLMVEIENGIENIQDKEIITLEADITYEEYLTKGSFFLENIIFSLDGDWYIFFNSDLYGVFTGTEEKVKIFKEVYSDWKIRTKLFQRFLSNYSQDKRELEKLSKKLWENENELTDEEKYEWIYRKYGK